MTSTITKGYVSCRGWYGNLNYNQDWEEQDEDYDDPKARSQTKGLGRFQEELVEARQNIVV